MRRVALLVAVAGAVLGPATPAVAHGGDTPEATTYRIRITAISAPEKGLAVRTVEAGARLELSNETGHPVEVLGDDGEPYLEVRPDGTYQNVNSPTTYRNETLTGDTPVPPSASPVAPPSWRRISTGTTVRWHDQRTRWLSAGLPPQAVADPGRSHRLREWTIPLRVQVRTFEIRGTLDWAPPPPAWPWLLVTAAVGLTATALLRKWPRSVAPLALIGGLSPILYVTTRTADGGAPSLMLVVCGLIAIGAAVRHPPFYLALSGAVLALFAGVAETAAFTAAVLPAAGPAWLTRAAVAVALGVGAALCLTGILLIRAALPPGGMPTADAPAARPAGLSSSS